MGEKKVANLSMRMWLDTIRTVIGTQELKSVLEYAHLEKYVNNCPPETYEMGIPFEDLRTLFFSLYELFGGRDLYILQLRMGRERARLSIEKYLQTARTLQTTACLFPEWKKIYMGLQRLKEETEKLYDTTMELREEDGSFFMVNAGYFESEGVASPVPVCGTFVGMLQYTTEWITGYPHYVEEVECRAMGDPADVFKIAKEKSITEPNLYNTL